TYRIVNGKKKIIGTRVVSRKNAGSYKTYETFRSKIILRRLIRLGLAIAMGLAVAGTSMSCTRGASQAWFRQQGGRETPVGLSEGDGRRAGRAGCDEDDARQRHPADRARRYAGDEARHQPRFARSVDRKEHVPAQSRAGELPRDAVERQAGRGREGRSRAFARCSGHGAPAAGPGTGHALRCRSRQQPALQSRLSGMDFGGRHDRRRHGRQASPAAGYARRAQIAGGRQLARWRCAGSACRGSPDP
ncbi:hypothetical protein EN766_37540, partial [Mesorhizobium sp. M2A.F.Ca.ET.046.02.1.1]